MAHICTYEEWDEFEPTEAEWKLIHAAEHSDGCVLGDGERPPAPEDAQDHDPEREIRAAVLRYLQLGGCKTFQTDDIGVWLVGAHITGTLDLDFTTLHGAIRLLNCRFERHLYMEQTQVAQLDMIGSHLNGLCAPGLDCKGNVYLRNVTCIETVSAIGAEIGGSLEFEGAELTPKEGMALNAQGITVHGGLIWRNMTAPTGLCDFTNANFQILVDDPAWWPDAENLIFDGMTYDRLGGTVPKDARTRLGWLERGSFWKGDFRPQP